ncbi:MAG: AAA family ATPase [Clostridia bacterium]|nr:AAA family ATPase [Clostridia bacterium]
MAEYKCISCGEVREIESGGSCPVCGYKMFEVPYDRREILVSEIRRFFNEVQVREVKRESFVFEGKNKDEGRFPNYDKILKYVAGRNRTEDFLDNLFETVRQLKLHYASPFSNTYPVSFEHVERTVRECDALLYEAARLLVPGLPAELKEIEWPEVSLLYAENPNRYLWPSANELLGLVEKLTQKIAGFIRVNNLYGNNHKYHPAKRGGRYNEKTDYKDELENAISKTETILRKSYVVDITDDGFDEFKEMLTCLWHDIELIMCSPLFITSYRYLVKPDKVAVSEEEMLGQVAAGLTERYRDFGEAVNIPDLLRVKTDEELLRLYKDLIALDDRGILMPVGSTFINLGESEKKLDELIGLSGIKESIRKIKAYALANKNSEDLNIHMCFLGNPGTGKTEVARLIAGILYENKVLPTNRVVEVDRNGLVSQYFGATAEKTSRVIGRAMGGVLFIDEAYALGNNNDAGSITDYGKEAIDTLVKAMEDDRGKFCVIFAGYRNEMQQMLSVNPGLKSRIPFTLDFPNYSRDELREITQLMLGKRNYSMGDAAMSRLLDITDIRRKDPNFANAREIRNILDQVIMCQNLRCAGTGNKELGLVDVNKYIKDSGLNLPTGSSDATGKVLTGEEELDQLIGLAGVKRMVKKIRAYARRNQGQTDFNLHMCFYGNPGTGKTEVARILSRILYDAGVLGEAKLVETDANGLIGKYVGETAPKTLKKINEAMGGVLFIDEAYSLTGSFSQSTGISGYGEEAIAVLLKEMEDRRGQFCTILAGYRDEMKQMISTNPGLESRIQFTLEFPDYTREELGMIAQAFLDRKRYTIDDDALVRVMDITDYFRRQPNFANARTVRNILNQVILNQNLRAEDDGENTRIILKDVEEYLTDEGIDLNKPAKAARRIGFV